MVTLCQNAYPPQASLRYILIKTMNRFRNLHTSRWAIGLSVAAIAVFSQSLSAQTAETSPPAIIQPGAPGEGSKVLPANTRGQLPPRSPKDVEFMQGMIMHHGQAVVMTALIEKRTQNKELRLLGARISHSQSEEMLFMKRWLAARGQPETQPMAGMDGMDMPGMDMSEHHQMLMPGMLTKKQMTALGQAKGQAFEKLFLKGMIQHHTGALTMVQELFDTPGAGQDGELFGFATDVDSGQRAEIRIMQDMLGKN